MRLLFWLGLVILVILALKKKAQPPVTRSGNPERPLDPENAGSQNVASAENMVCCAHCQIYLPASEAVQRAGQVYCSQEHADLA
ncbi:PP0621 family protein [Undibacterium sp. Tian12W]|uniref:PP0621 family protein n=1 Tax=Undibacterium sp. Tian12W TaxID=3413054 RepID=UPI003BF413D3